MDGVINHGNTMIAQKKLMNAAFFYLFFLKRLRKCDHVPHLFLIRLAVDFFFVNYIF